MSDTIKQTVKHAIWNHERFEDNKPLRSDEIVGITRAEAEVFVEIEQQLTAERDAALAENERLREAADAVVAAWDFDEIGQVDAELIDGLRKEQP